VAPSRYVQARWAWISALGLTATLAAAALAFLSRDITRYAEILVFLTVVVSAPYVTRADPRAWLYLVLVAFAAWMLCVDAFFHIAPGAADDPVSFLRNFSKMFFFLFAGWWLGGREHNAALLLAAGAIATDTYETRGVFGGIPAERIKDL
jgi:uncharacterized membrane protein